MSQNILYWYERNEGQWNIYITPAQISWRNNLLHKACKLTLLVGYRESGSLSWWTIWRKGGGGLECHQNGCYWVSSNTWFRHMFQNITGRFPNTSTNPSNGAADQTLWTMSYEYFQMTFCCSCATTLCQPDIGGHTRILALSHLYRGGDKASIAKTRIEQGHCLVVCKIAVSFMYLSKIHTWYDMIIWHLFCIM